MRWKRLMAAGSMLSVVAAGCATDDGSPGSGALTVKLGAVLPLTGDLTDFGPAMAAAYELAGDVFEEAAASAEYDITVDLAPVEDSETKPAAGVEAAEKLVRTQGVNAIVGGAASSVTIAIAQSVTIPDGIVQCTPASTSGDITKLEDDDLVYRVPPNDEFQAPILAALVIDDLGADATINVGARNDAYGNFLISGVETELKAAGVTVGKKVLWDPKATSFDSEAADLVSGDPDGWVLVDFPGTWQKVGPALVRTGDWDPAKTYSADGLKTSKLPQAPPTGSGKETTEGMKGTAPGGVGDFGKLWAERVTDVGRETFDAHTFDCTILILLAAVAADSSDPDDIKAEMARVSGPGGTKYSFEQLEEAIAALANGEDIDYEGASGPVDFDENGDPRSVGAVYEIYEFTDGALTVVGTQQAKALDG